MSNQTPNSQSAAAPPPTSDALPTTLAEMNARLPVPLSQKTFAFFFAGAAARTMGAILTSPLDTLKARLQFQQKVTGIKQYNGPWDAATKIFKQEGIGAFYRGLPARLVYIAPAAAISFVFFEEFRSLFHKPKTGAHQYLYAMLPLVAGGFARVAGTAMRTPFDVIRQRMQVSGSIIVKPGDSAPSKELPRGVYRHTGDAFVRVFRTEGLRSFWAGFGATLLRDVPFSAIYFLSYETLKEVQKTAMKRLDIPDRKLSSKNYLLAGAGAAACAVTITNPLDVVKTRLQTQGSLSTPRYKGIRDCFRKTWQEEGARGFTRGLAPRLLYLCPSAAITFALYETLKRFISRRWFKDEQVLQIK